MNKPALSTNPTRIRSRMRAACPHCGALAAIRSSKRITPLYSEVRFECGNPECGHVWVASLGVLRTLVPSDRPNPAVSIPCSVVVDAAPAKTLSAG